MQALGDSHGPLIVRLIRPIRFDSVLLRCGESWLLGPKHRRVTITIEELASLSVALVITLLLLEVDPTLSLTSGRTKPKPKPRTENAADASSKAD